MCARASEREREGARDKGTLSNYWQNVKTEVRSFSTPEPLYPRATSQPLYPLSLCRGRSTQQEKDTAKDREGGWKGGSEGAREQGSEEGREVGGGSVWRAGEKKKK